MTTYSTALHHIGALFPTRLTTVMKSDVQPKPDRTDASGDVNIQGAGDQRQPTLQEMLDDMRKAIGPWLQEIEDYTERMEIRDDISFDIVAAEQALEDYLAAHPDREGPLDFSAISITLPETSPLRTAEAKTKTFQELMTYYKDTHKELKLPALPTSWAGLDGYQKAMAAVEDIGSLPAVKQETLKMQAAMLCREQILDAMRLLAEKYGEIMKNMLLR